MEKLHILVLVPLEKRHLDSIAAVDPGVEVKYALDELRAERGLPRPPGPQLKEKALSLAEASEALDRMLADTDVIFGWRVPRNLLSRAPNLKWVQGIGAGVDKLAGDTGLLQSDVIVTGASGVRTTTVAEFSLCLMLMLAKKAPRFLASQQAHLWKPGVGLQLSGKTLGVIGLGSIGSEIARLATAFGMKVLASKRSVTGRVKGTAGVDEIFPPGELLEMLPRCDFVVLATPLTSETKGLIGEAELRAMKPSAYLINIARGPVIKQDILLRALKEGWIAGAALDVFEAEPLPADSELWDLPNVIVTPHVAGLGEYDSDRVTALFCENLRRFLAGRELVNVIDKEMGY